MGTSTKCNPLIINYMTPRTPEVVSSNQVTVFYDPKTQITMYMGGKSKPTRCNDGYKKTVEHDSGTAVYTHNDAERYTDD